MIIKTCQYCNAEYLKDTEHVFPLGLGGEDVFLDCVCSACNNKFSALERELYQKSPIGLIRSVEGVRGYKRGNSKASFKAPLLLSHEKINNIVYEVGQSEKMALHLRPQIIEINKILYIEGDSQTNVDRLLMKFKDWKNSNLKVVLKFPETKNDKVRFIQIGDSKSNFEHSISTDYLKIKNEIVLDLLPKSHKLYKYLETRIYMDDDFRLKIRARTENQGIKFILKLLKFSDTKQVIKSFPVTNKNLPEVSVGMSFDSKKCEQALVKIGVNVLLHYFPHIKNKPQLQNFKDFVKTGNRTFNVQMESRNKIIDTIAGTHNIFIYQMDNFLNIRISLFNGQFAFSFCIPDLGILSQNNCCRVVIDYKQFKNRLENHTTFLESFS
ncbi:HNH endonuclease [Flavobacterium sp. PL02]|uniref:HNH endonuclease n=1 Tax=Flavobacterium sp. PL02 TaxID=3088354 RepID=UPI002B2281C8|nr:HNH endonuclease [Flavobacterium sp. PL02]MEA9414313.1 HNH endonuclease [Flavobacterium sp. PL02]